MKARLFLAAVLALGALGSTTYGGVDARFKRLGMGFSQSEFNGQTVNTTSLAFYF